MYQHTDQKGKESIHKPRGNFCIDATYLHRCHLRYLQKTFLTSIMAKLQNIFAIHSVLLDFYYDY